MPGLVTIIFHAECLGAWTYFWEPCGRAWPFGDSFEAASRMSRRWSTIDRTFRCDFVFRSDICSLRWDMNGRDCMEAAVEQGVSLLYPKFAHSTFTMAAFRMVKVKLGSQGMKLEGSHALLALLWLM
eukprot:2673372-Amphidinium_carterae.1